MGKPTEIPKQETRTICLDRAQIKADGRTVDLAFSSEEPVVRGWGIEILSHDSGSMRMDRANQGIPLLFNHNRDVQIGILENCMIGDDRKSRGVARFSRSPMAEEKFSDVRDGILKDVSVGYMVHFMEELDAKKLPMSLMEMAAREKLPVYRITDWEPFECSMVTVPADPTVGVGRTKGADPEQEKPPDRIHDRNEPPDEAPSGASIISGEVRKMEEDKGKTLVEVNDDLRKEREKGVQVGTNAERVRQEGINSLWLEFSNFVPKMLRDKAVADGSSVEDFQKVVLARMKDPQPINAPVSELGLSKREVARYSVTKAVLSQLPGEKVDASFERACHEELVKRGVQAQRGGILVPYDISRQKADPRGTGKRDLSIVGGDDAGGYLVGQDQMGSEFIDVLRNSMVLRELGARVLSGLRGNVAVPKRTAGATSYWVTETSAPTEGANTFGQLLLTPKTVGAFIDYTRELLIQSNPSIDALVNGDLALSLATAIDLAGFHGTGTEQPQGIVGSSGVGATTATAVSFAKMLDFQTDVAGANALSGNCAYVTTPAVAAILASVPRFTYATKGLWDGNLLRSEDVCGFRGRATNQITAGYCIFGDFSQIVIGEWGVLELLVNPFVFSSTRIIRVTAFQAVDVGLRYGGAFSVSTSVTAPS